MKPIQLTMTAFGPYKDKEVINFNELNGHHLFVISGATGAGKTTIFDGICFALYGSASGSDRENTAMLRSHFADDDIHTSVEFIFEIKGRTFRVLRQLGHIKTGNKTKTGERYEFFECTDNGEVPFVDRQMVSEINEKVEQLVGLTEDQFKQIVMLPQGEFRKLLTSETENKEAILRRLFKTERYKDMNHLLKEKIDAIQINHLQEKQRLNHYLESIPSNLDNRENAVVFAVLDQEYYNVVQVIDGLKEEMTYYQDKIKLDEAQYAQTLKQFNNQQQAYHQALAVNERFIVFENKNSELKSLLEQKATFSRYEQQLKEAVRANVIVPYEKQLSERKNEAQQLKNHVQICENQLKIAQKELLLAQDAYTIEEKKVEEREERKAQIRHYESFLPIVQEVEQTKQALHTKKASIAAQDETLKQKAANINTQMEKINLLKQRLKTQETEIEHFSDKQLKVQQLRQHYTMIKDYLDWTQSETKLKENLQQKEQAYRLAENIYKQHETNWIEQQAVVLAGHLHDGEPCPVCGSLSHPEKAEAEGDMITKEQLEQLKQDMGQKQKEHEELLVKHRSYMMQIQEKAQMLSEQDIDIENAEKELQVTLFKGKEVNKEVEHLQKVKENVIQNKKNVEQLEKSNHQLTEEKQHMEKTFYEARTDYSSLKATFTERLSKIPKELQVLKELQDTLQKMKQVADDEERKWKAAQVAIKETGDAHTTAKVTLNNKKVQLADLQQSVEKARISFETELKGAAFLSVEAYEQAKMTPEDQDSLQQKLDAYKEKTGTLERQLIELQEELKDKERSDTEALQTELSALKTIYEQAFTAWNHSKNQLELIETLTTNIQETKQKEAALEKEIATITDVYNMLRGQNSKKISFERYLQIDYLDQIILAANGRFKQLMNGQFYLLRSDRQEAYGKQSGLAIDVYDVYTGQTRDVKTLSGGEKFTASLCLALGMSDVIQSYQGGIAMDTMFIDEGFGSLDEESLHKSIDALIQLQATGRMIGVISHVEELKTIFPATLEVRKTKEGHSKTSFVLK